MFKNIKLPPPKKRIARRIAMDPSGKRIRVMVKTPRQLYDCKRIGKQLYLNGVRMRVFNIPDLARFFGVSMLTMRAWYRKGYLPDPYLIRRTDKGESVMWVSMQVLVFMRFLNVAFRAGYVKVPWNHLAPHLPEMKELAREAVHKHNKRHHLVENKYDRLGVNFDD